MGCDRETLHNDLRTIGEAVRERLAQDNWHQNGTLTVNPIESWTFLLDGRQPDQSPDCRVHEPPATWSPPIARNRTAASGALSPKAVADPHARAASNRLMPWSREPDRGDRLAVVEFTQSPFSCQVPRAIGETSSPLIPSLTLFIVLSFVDG